MNIITRSLFGATKDAAARLADDYGYVSSAALARELGITPVTLRTRVRVGRSLGMHWPYCWSQAAKHTSMNTGVGEHRELAERIAKARAAKVACAGAEIPDWMFDLIFGETPCLLNS